MAKQGRQAIWTRRIAACERSGLSRRAWCVAQGVNVHTLDYWRYRLRAAGTKAPAKRSPRTARQALVPLRVVGPVASDDAIELRCGEWRLRLPRCNDPALSAQVRLLKHTLHQVSSCPALEGY